MTLIRLDASDTGNGRPTPATVRGVLFDLDDTLHDRSAAFRRWAEAFAEAQMAHLSADERTAVVEWLVGADEGGYCARPLFAARVTERFPNAVSESVEEFVEALQIGVVAHISLAAGADALLDALAARAIPWGIVTNGTVRQQNRKIDVLGLGRRASCVFISEAFGCKKPAPEIFAAAAGALRVPPGHILFVGDHAVNDVGGAQGAGMMTSWLRRGQVWSAQSTTTAPDYAVDDLEELAMILAERTSP